MFSLGVVNCFGAVIVHADGTIAYCTEDDEPDGCRGREVRHEGDPVPCVVWTPAGCDHRGVQF